MFTRKYATAVPLLAATAIICFAGRAWSAEGVAEVTGSTDLGVLSKYVWRGIPVTDGLVLEPGVGVSVSGLSLGIWANMDIDDANGMAGEMNEVDYTLDYTFAAGEKASISVGAILYTFPNTTFESTTELYAGASFDVPGSPSVTLYKDVDEAEGFYASFGAGYGVPLPGDRTLDLGLALGFGSADHNAFYYGATGGGASDILFTVGTTFNVTETFSVTPAITFAAALGNPKDALDAAGLDTSNAIIGVTLSASF